jgi:hypothetical protein
MHPILLEATQETSRWTTGEQHTAALLGIILTVLGILVAYFKLKNQHKETILSREKSVIASNDQKELLEEIAKEFKPNHGSSLVDRVNSIGTSVDSHISAAEVWFAENDKAHEEIKKLHADSCIDINRRVDGIYEIILGSSATTPRKTAARHLNREEPPNES